MSKFYDAMARSAGNVPEPVDQAEPDQKDADRETAKAPQVPGAVEDAEPRPVDVPIDRRPESTISGDRVLRTSVRPGGGERTFDDDVYETPISPAYERIIQKLFTFRKSPRQGVIAVAGAIPGEGSSTVARNTALALGRGRMEQVALVDANIRNPVQHERFRIDRADGLVDVLRGPVTLSAAVKPDVAPGLSLLTAGSPCDSPPRLLTVSALQGVVMALTSLFDWVIIDAPPLTLYPEAASIASACGGAMLVIQAEKTRSEVAEEAKKVLNDSGVDLLGAVLNRRKYHIPGFIYRRL